MINLLAAGKITLSIVRYMHVLIIHCLCPKVTHSVSKISLPVQVLLKEDKEKVLQPESTDQRACFVSDIC
jgi:hypothetical protein